MDRREHRYVPGKVDYNGNGRANCEAEITWSLENGEFSMSAGIWQPNKRDYLTCGQCVDTVADYFPHDEKVQRMRAVWQRWHLNKMHAGSQVQEDYLRAHPIPKELYGYPHSHYEVASRVLTDAGLNPDSEGYTYGHAWKHEDLPADIVAEIQSWG